MDQAAKHYLFTKRQHIAILVMLAVEFVLGVALGTLAPYDPHKVSLAHTITLDVHIALGALLLIGGVFRVVLAYRWHENVRAAAIAGLVCLLGAFASGEAAIHDKSDAAVFFMAMFFMAAVLVYSMSLARLRKQSSSS